MTVNLQAKGELRLQMELSLLISGPQDREEILDWPGGPHTITRGLKSGRGRRERKALERNCGGWSRDATWLASKMEEGARSHGTRVASRSRKG